MHLQPEPSDPWARRTPSWAAGGELCPPLDTSVLWAVLGTQSYPYFLFQAQHASLTPNFISSVRPPHQMARLGHASGNSCTFLGGKGGSNRDIGARGQGDLRRMGTWACPTVFCHLPARAKEAQA